MPAISRILEVLLYSLTMFLPWLVMTYYPFRSRLRFSSGLVALGAAVLAAGRIALDLTAAWGFSGSTAIHIILVVLYVGCYAVSLKASPAEMALNMVLVAALGFLCQSIVGWIFQAVTSHLSVDTYSWAHSVMLLGIAVAVSLIYCLAYEAIKVRILALVEKKPQSREEPLEADKPDDETAPKAKKLLLHLPKKNLPPCAPEAEPIAPPAPAEPAPQPEPVAPPVAEVSITEAPAEEPVAEKSAPEEVVAPQPAEDPTVSEDAQPQPPVVSDLEQLRSMQFTSLNARILESRQLRKDLRRQIDTMTECLNTKNYERLQAMLHAMRQQFSTTSYSSNAALSAPLDYYSQLARSRGIPMNIDVQLPENSFASIDPADLILILGNLLDNALEACKVQNGTKRQISVSIKPYGSSLRMVIKNTSTQAAQCNEQGQYLSSKYDGPGAGLQTVQAIAERYQGKLEISQKEDRFCVRVTLNP